MLTLRSCPELGLIIQKDPISHSRRSMFLEMVWCGHSLLGKWGPVRPLQSARLLVRRKKRKHINSLQSLNDGVHLSPSTIGGEQVADACFQLASVFHKFVSFSLWSFQVLVKAVNQNVSAVHQLITNDLMPIPVSW
ncbi:hypothetical protein TNCV_4023941 [Trichonephila clavipes]|nr:hypothetical protein TNCV_4023941 [Trichonephila clavipes]